MQKASGLIWPPPHRWGAAALRGPAAGLPRHILRNTVCSRHQTGPVLFCGSAFRGMWPRPHTHCSVAGSGLSEDRGKQVPQRLQPTELELERFSRAQGTRRPARIRASRRPGSTRRPSLLTIKRCPVCSRWALTAPAVSRSGRGGGRGLRVPEPQGWGSPSAPAGHSSPGQAALRPREPLALPCDPALNGPEPPGLKTELQASLRGTRELGLRWTVWCSR